MSASTVFFFFFWNHSSVTQTIDSSILIMTVNTQLQCYKQTFYSSFSLIHISTLQTYLLT